MYFYVDGFVCVYIKNGTANKYATNKKKEAEKKKATTDIGQEIEEEKNGKKLVKNFLFFLTTSSKHMQIFSQTFPDFLIALLSCPTKKHKTRKIKNPIK